MKKLRTWSDVCAVTGYRPQLRTGNFTKYTNFSSQSDKAFNLGIIEGTLYGKSAGVAQVNGSGDFEADLNFFLKGFEGLSDAGRQIHIGFGAAVTALGVKCAHELAVY
jgi:hypothetical protein